jgi:large subunit ribosomal protein L22
MQIQVKLSYLRIAPRKTRQIVDLVRGKTAVQAATILEFVVRKPAEPILKLLKSAMATAKTDSKLDVNNLYISKITANEGPKLKRSRPVSRGSAHPLWKRTSHIVLVLDEIKPTVRQAKDGAKNGEILNQVAEGNADIKENDLTKKKEKQKFEKTNQKMQKGPGSLNRMFRRKSI